jgi:outer membrane lipoprotein-sorting protein
MKLIITKNVFSLALSLSATLASGQASTPLPTANDIVTKMMQFDARRQAQLPGYTATRRYVAVNKNRHAEMTVHVECAGDGAKQFTILSEQGSGSIRKHVFQKLLSEETEASRRGTRTSTRLIPANYDFQIVRQETLETRPAYVLEVRPRTPSKYLINGKIWVDANDYSIVRIEGEPARNPSFWVHSVHFIHTYQKVGDLWLASSTNTTSEVRIFGESELTIANSDYKLNPSNKSNATSSELNTEARLAQ